MVTLRSVRNCRVHGDFKNIFAFQTHISSHTINQKIKQKTKGSQRTRTLDMQATKQQTQPNTS